VEVSSPSRSSVLPEPSTLVPAPDPLWDPHDHELGPPPTAAQVAPIAPAVASEPMLLACRPIGRLNLDQVVILLYELRDRGTGVLRGYQSVVLSHGAAAHA
jgi:hypothetical protein